MGMSLTGERLPTGEFLSQVRHHRLGVGPLVVAVIGSVPGGGNPVRRGSGVLDAFRRQ